jgi:Flp pilus assembly secretin CpaC
MRRAVTGLALAIMMTGAALQAGPAAAMSPGGAGLITLTVDQAAVMRLDEPAGTIILGNPLIADAAVQDAETLVLTGRSFGVTNLIILDSGGREILNRQVSVGGTAGHLVTVHRATIRTSLSCTPDCESAPMVGDDSSAFDEITGQITSRNGLSVPQ